MRKLKFALAFLLGMVVVSILGVNGRSDFSESSSPSLVVIAKQESPPVAIFIHGWGGDTSEFKIASEQFEMRGYVTARMLLPKDGTPRELLGIVVAQYDEIMSELPKGSKVTIVGLSLGAYLAAQLTEIRRIDALVMESPASYPDQFFDTKLSEVIGDKVNYPLLMTWRNEPQAPDASASFRALHRFQGKVLFLGGDHDQAVSNISLMTQFTATPRAQVIIVNGGHGPDGDEDRLGYAKLMLDWLIGPLPVQITALY